jgi:hypothetical protein
MPRRIQTHADWIAEGTQRFGGLGRDLQFRCVSCGEVQTPAEYVALGFTPEQAMSRAPFGCIGREDRSRGCDWTLGGLLHLHTLEVELEEGETIPVFEFATPENAPGPGFQPVGRKNVAQAVAQ